MTLSWKSLGWLRGGRGHRSLIKTLLSFSVTISGGTLQNCQRSAISDLQKQHSLVSLFRILLYFSAQQPDHVIPLPENVLLPSWSAPNKIQAPGLGLLRGPAGPGPCLAPFSDSSLRFSGLASQLFLQLTSGPLYLPLAFYGCLRLIIQAPT